MHAMLTLIPWYHWAWIVPLLAGGGYAAFVFRAVLGPFASAVPMLAWQILGALAFVGLVAWWAMAHGEENGKALQLRADTVLIDAANTARDEAISANGTNQATIATLKQSELLCESGRLADQAAQATAMAERNKATVVAQAAYAKARANMDALNAGRCQSTAKRAVCGATP